MYEYDLNNEYILFLSETNKKHFENIKENEKLKIILVEPKLIEIKSLDKDGIKQRYKELRRSGANTHGKGGGIGFYEIAKRCDMIEYEFTQINENKFYFHFKATIKISKEKQW